MSGVFKRIMRFVVAVTTISFLATATGRAANKGFLYNNPVVSNVSKYPYFVSAVAVWPVKSGGKITSEFGERSHPITNEYDFHTGVDISSFKGDLIVASFGGRVSKVMTDSIYGNCLVIDHGANFSTFYAHCDTISVGVGTVVRRGETIATQGSTGWSTGPHLHFEVRIEGVRVNPSIVLSECEEYGV